MLSERDHISARLRSPFFHIVICACTCAASSLAGADDIPAPSVLCEDDSCRAMEVMQVGDSKKVLLQQSKRLQNISSHGKDSTVGQLKMSKKTAELMQSIRNEKAFRSLRAASPGPGQDREPDAFLKRHNCAEEPTVKAVFQEIDKRKEAVTESAVVQQYEELGELGFIFNISGREVSYTAPGGTWTETLDVRAQQYQSMLEELVNEVKLPNMRFVLSMMDGAPGGDLVFKNEGFVGRELLMVPRGLLDWGSEVSNMVQRTESSPCQNIVRKGVFRGASTGSGTEGWVWDQGQPLPLRDPTGWVPPRYETVQVGKEHPDILDAGFTQVVGVGEHDNEMHEAMAYRGLVKEHLSDDQQRCYASVVVIDGNAQADRLPRQMAYGTAVIFMHNSTRGWQKPYSELTHTKNVSEIGNDEFWYKEPENGTAWVSVRNVVELEQALRQILADEERHKELGKKSLHYVKHNLSASRLKCYMYHLMNEYGKRYNNLVQ